MERYRNRQPYDPNAGPWPVQYSEEEMQQQRDAGRNLLERFRETLDKCETVFDISEGVYRIDDCLLLDNYEHGMHFKAANVELIMEGDKRPIHIK